MANVYIVYHSGYGHTNLQAEAVHRGAASVAGTRAEIRTTEEASANLGQSEISLRYPDFSWNAAATGTKSPTQRSNLRQSWLIDDS
jgi:hypothetical protein